jgi:hypothetical protein
MWGIGQLKNLLARRPEARFLKLRGTLVGMIGTTDQARTEAGER